MTGKPISADPALPVAGTADLSGIRKSTHGKWRALVLVAVHVFIVLHVVHFLVRGETLSPVEPSESMYTLELGELNAGFVFFVVAILATLVFGRFVCGWACHLIAVQDLCAWAMKKVGVRPRPFRSRLLHFMPFFLAYYMFLWPSLVRVFEGRSHPGLTSHLMTDGFWDTFAGPVFATLTIAVSGALIVYLLGAKAFCSYGCPYGALFTLADRVTPGKILVTEDCEQCGHCTATCTSNVRVHEEVRDHGMVVDPGCMKCTDCVSVCPKNALYYGFSTPTVVKRPPDLPRLFGEATLLAVFGATTAGLHELVDLSLSNAFAGGIAGAWLLVLLWQLLLRPDGFDARAWLERSALILVSAAIAYGMALAYEGTPPWMSLLFGSLAGLVLLWIWRTVNHPGRVYNLSVGEELLVGVVCVAAIWTFRGLYDGPPLLMAMGLGAITGYLCLQLLNLWRKSTVRIQNLHLKVAGTVRLSGRVFIVLALGWLAFGAHSAFAQWHRQWGGFYMSRTEATRAEALSGAAARGEYTERHREATEKLLRHFSLADRWGLEPLAEIKLGLAWGHLLQDDPRGAEEQIRAAVALAPDRPEQYRNLIDLLIVRQRYPEAIEALQEKIRNVEPNPEDPFVLAGLLAGAERYDEAVEQYEHVLALAPDSAVAHYNLGGIQRRLGRFDRAVHHLEAAVELAPDDADAQVELGLAYTAVGRNEAALEALRRAIELNPETPEARVYLPQLIEQIELGTSDSE